jgi:tetratricopeptide (TPR) repeat protein
MQDLELRSDDGQAVEVTYSDETMINEIDNILRLVPPLVDGIEGTERDPPAGMDVNAMKFDMAADFMAQGYFFQARKIFQELAQGNFKEYDSLVQLGIAHWRLGDITEAISDLNRAMFLDTGRPDAWHRLGLIMLESERPMLNEARAFLRQASRLGPGDAEISASLQRCEMMIKGYTA